MHVNGRTEKRVGENRALTGGRTASGQEHDLRDQAKDASSYQKTVVHQISLSQSRSPQWERHASRTDRRALRDAVSMAEKLEPGSGCLVEPRWAIVWRGAIGNRVAGYERKRGGQRGQRLKRGSRRTSGVSWLVVGASSATMPRWLSCPSKLSWNRPCRTCQ